MKEQNYLDCLVGVFGHPAAENPGVVIQEAAFRALGLNLWRFLTIDVDPDKLEDAIKGLKAFKMRGINCTIPHKINVIPYLDELSESARLIGAVNTIVNTDGHLVAYNTDYLAIEALLSRHAVPTSGEVAVLGSGGMAKATVAACANNGYSGVVVARNERTGAALASKYGFTWVPDLGPSRPHTIINCTPIGLEGGSDAGALPVVMAAVDAAGVIFDVVPRPARTPLVAAGEERGKVTITGAEVMSLQALEQFVLYTGIRPEEELVRRAAEYARG